MFHSTDLEIVNDHTRSKYLNITESNVTETHYVAGGGFGDCNRPCALHNALAWLILVTSNASPQTSLVKCIAVMHDGLDYMMHYVQ